MTRADVAAALNAAIDAQEGGPDQVPNPVVVALVALLRLRDTDTEEHCWRVARFANRLADAIQDGYSAWNSADSASHGSQRQAGGQSGSPSLPRPPSRPVCRKRLLLGAVLHDIGKVGVRDAVLLKPGPLTPAERIEMEAHVQLGIAVLGRLPSLAAALPVVACHHEQWDGNGYPSKLRGAEIPIEARIFSIVDCYDAVTSDRPYRGAMPHQAALGVIRRESGARYDPELVAVFETIPEEDWDALR